MTGESAHLAPLFPSSENGAPVGASGRFARVASLRAPIRFAGLGPAAALPALGALPAPALRAAERAGRGPAEGTRGTPKSLVHFVWLKSSVN